MHNPLGTFRLYTMCAFAFGRHCGLGMALLVVLAMAPPWCVPAALLGAACAAHVTA